MANIKFSGFAAETNVSNVTEIVGLTAAGNIKITPTNLLAGVGGVTVNTQAVNQLVACSAVTDTLDGEVNLTFNGSELTVTGDITTTGTISGNGSKLAVTEIESSIGAAGTAGDMGLNAETYTRYTSVVVGGSFYYLGSGGWSLSSASASGQAAQGMIGMATSISSGTGMVIRGICYVLTDPGGVEGDIIYLSTATGRLTNIPVATGGNVSRVMGYKIGTNLVYFNPSNDWIVIS